MLRSTQETKVRVDLDRSKQQTADGGWTRRATSRHSDSSFEVGFTSPVCLSPLRYTYATETFSNCDGAVSGLSVQLTEQLNAYSNTIAAARDTAQSRKRASRINHTARRLQRQVLAYSNATHGSYLQCDSCCAYETCAFNRMFADRTTHVVTHDNSYLENARGRSAKMKGYFDDSDEEDGTSASRSAAGPRYSKPVLYLLLLLRAFLPSCRRLLVLLRYSSSSIISFLTGVKGIHDFDGDVKD